MYLCLCTPDIVAFKMEYLILLKAMNLLKLLKEYDICNLILVPFKILDFLHGYTYCLNKGTMTWIIFISDLDYIW